MSRIKNSSRWQGVALLLSVAAMFVCPPVVGQELTKSNQDKWFRNEVTSKPESSPSPSYATITRSYGPFDVTFYNNGDTNGWKTSQGNWTETQMSDVAACIATWDSKIANTAGRQIKLHMFWEDYSGTILGGSYSPTNGDGTNMWSYPERIWRDTVNYDGRWDGFDTIIAYDTDAAGFAWNYGVGNPAGSQVDFRSVVTHEIGHALGFFDSYDPNYDNWGIAWGTETNPYSWANYRGLTQWDQLLKDDAGNSPSIGGPGPPNKFNEEDNPVWFTGAEAVGFNGGNVAIYAPASYEPGSSLAHLNDSNFPNALMKHAISLGQANREPTDLEWAMMRDMGWSIVPWVTLYFDAASGATDWDSTTANWSDTPSGPYYQTWISGSDAVFEGTANTVNVSGTISSVNSIRFDIDGYTLGSSPSSGTITLTGSGGSITTQSGSNTINSVLAGTVGLSKFGTGTLTLTGSNNYAGQTILSAGTLELGINAQSPILTGGGVDVQGYRLVFDYTSTADNPSATIKSLLAVSYASDWTTGQFISSTHAADVGLGWVDNGTATTVTVQPAIYGDATLDGTVDINDLSKVLTAYEDTGKVWDDGDFTYDGTVDISDLSKVLTNYNQSLGLAGSSVGMAAGLSTVPEPGTLLLLISAAAVVAGLRPTVRQRLRRHPLRRQFFQ